MKNSGNWDHCDHWVIMKGCTSLVVRKLFQHYPYIIKKILVKYGSLVGHLQSISYHFGHCEPVVRYNILYFDSLNGNMTC